MSLLLIHDLHVRLLRVVQQILKYSDDVDLYYMDGRSVPA